MPFYEFYCKTCDKTEEKLVKMGTKTIDCPLCGGKMYKIMSPTTFILKGGGWSRTGYDKVKLNKQGIKK